MDGAPTGHLVYALNGVLYAVPFDLDTRQVTGGAVPLVEGVGDAANVSGDAHFSVAANGSLAQTFVWVDRAGRVTPVPGRPRPYQEFNLSPDGRWLAYESSESGIDGHCRDHDTGVHAWRDDVPVPDGQRYRSRCRKREVPLADTPWHRTGSASCSRKSWPARWRTPLRSR